MPIEIRELHIKASIEDTGTGAQRSQERPRINTNSSSSSTAPPVDDIVALAVEQVMELLRQQKER